MYKKIILAGALALASSNAMAMKTPDQLSDEDLEYLTCSLWAQEVADKIGGGWKSTARDFKQLFFESTGGTEFEFQMAKKGFDSAMVKVYRQMEVKIANRWSYAMTFYNDKELKTGETCSSLAAKLIY